MDALIAVAPALASGDVVGALRLHALPARAFAAKFIDDSRHGPLRPGSNKASRLAGVPPGSVSS